MRKISKKLLAVLMIAVMLMSAAPLSGVLAYADSVEEQPVAGTQTEEPLKTLSLSEEQESVVKYAIKVDETLAVDIIAGEVTYIEFVPEADGFYELTSNSEMYIDGYLYDENYDRIAYDYGYGGDFSIKKILYAGKSYYYGVRYSDTTISGNFEITLTCLAERFEDIELGETLTAEIASGKTPYIRFTPENTGVYVFTAYTDPDAYIYLCNSNLDWTTSRYNDNGEGKTLQIADFLYEGEDYYFVAQDYYVSANVDVTVDQPKETIEVGKTLTADIDYGNSPFIKFVPEADGLYVFTVPCENGVNVCLYNEYLYSMENEYADGENGNVKIGDYLYGGSTYYLRAENYTSFESVDITLSEVEDVDIKIGETVTLDFVSSYTPYARFVPETDGLYVIKSDCAQYSYRELYDSNKNRIRNEDCNGHSSFAALLSAGETYYFRANDAYDNGAQSVELTVIQAEDVVIKAGETLTDSVVSGDTSYIRFVPETDGTYIFTVPAEYDICMYLYNGDMSLITREWSYVESGTVKLAEYFEAGKTYYFCAEGYSADSISITLEKAPEVVIKAGQTLTADIYSDKTDYIKFVPETDGTYVFTLPLEYSAGASLYGENKKYTIEHGYSSDNEERFQLAAYLFAGETYYFRAEGYSEYDSIPVTLAKEKEVVIEAGDSLTAPIYSRKTAYIKFVPEIGRAYCFEVNNDNYVSIHLYDEYFNEICVQYSDDSGDKVQLERPFVGGETYYFKVYSTGNSIDVSLEINDITIEADKTLTVDLSSGNSPYIRFVPEKSGEYIFTMPSENYMYASLYDENFETVGYYAYKDRVFELRAFLKEGETYYLKASNYSSYERIDVSLVMEEELSIKTDETLKAEFDKEYTPYIRFVPEKDGRYIFTAETNDYAYLYLYDEDLEMLANSYVSEKTDVYAFLTKGNTYYLRAENYNQRVKSITLTVTEDDSVRIYDIAAGETLAMEHYSDEYVYLRFAPETDETYFIRSISDYAMRCTLYSEGNDYLVGDYGGGYNDNFKLMYSFNAGKTYYFRINIDSYEYSEEPVRYNYEIKLTEICSHTLTNGTEFCNKCGDPVFDYYVGDGHLRITGCDAWLKGAVVIPEMINGYTVEEIDSYAFSYNSEITEIYLPKTVKIPYGLEFYYDTLLKNILVDGQSEYYTSVDGILYSKDMKTIVLFPAGRDETFFEIPESVETIGPNAFYGCQNLETVIIPAGVKEIRSGAFRECSNLKDVTLPENLEVLEGVAFFECSSLEKIVIPAKVKETGTYTFAHCSELASVKLPDGIEIIDNGAFYECVKLTEIVIPSSVKKIGGEAFAHCSKLASVTISDGVETIEENAFYYCNKLTEIVIPASVKEIGDNAFGYCSSLADITVMGNKTSFNRSTFWGTAHYNNSDNWKNENDFRFYYIGGYLADWSYNGSEYPTEMIISNDTKIIVDEAFMYAGGISKVTLPDGLEYIGDEAFYGSSITEINLPAGVELGEFVFVSCYDLSIIRVEGSVKGLDISDVRDTEFIENKENYEDGVLYLGNSLIKVDPKVISGEFTVRDGTEIISEEAFANFTSLTSVSIPSSVKYIGEGAFRLCTNLESVNLSEGLETICDNAFAGCIALKSTELPSTVKEIGKNVFALNISLETAVLPENVTEIPEAMFAGCINLKSAPITEKTVSVGEGAFAFCTSLTEINIGASVEEIGLFAFTGCSSVERFTVDAANSVFETDSYGALYMISEDDEIGGKILHSYPAASPATSYSLPEDVAFMGYPFVSCLNLETIDIHEGFAINPKNGEFSFDAAYESLLIATAGMKVDANSLVEYVKNFNGDVENTIRELLDFIMKINGDDEAALVNAINNIINRVCNFIQSKNNVDQVCDDVVNWVAQACEAASNTNFKGFNVSDAHPNISDDDGILYITDDSDDDGTLEKILVSCPAEKTGRVRIDSDTTDILPFAFGFCNLKEVVIPSSIRNFENLTFALSNIEKLEVPSNVEGISELTFALANVSTLNLKNSICFENNYYSEVSFILLFADEIILPDSLEEIPEYVFAGCLAKSYKLPSKLKHIGEGAFVANIFLESIDIPSKTEYIGDAAFAGCIKLKEVNVKSVFLSVSKLKTIGNLAFAFTNIEEFEITQNVENIGTLAFNPSAGRVVEYFANALIPMFEDELAYLAEKGYHFDLGRVDGALRHVASWFTRSKGVTVNSRNRSFKANNGDLYSYDSTNLIKAAETKGGFYEIPSGVMKISNGAFAFTYVNDIYIPDSVSTLESGAFSYTMLSEISLGGGIREIPASLFTGSYLLKRVTILPTVVSIDENAFSGCSDDLTIVGYAYSYAHEYAIEHEINFETIDGKGYVSIKAPSEVASEKIPVYGNTLANTKVEICVNGIKVGDAESGENGYWRTTVEIPEPVNNTVYSVTAKVDAGTEREVESKPVLVTYTTSLPVFESIICYHGNQKRSVTMDNIGETPSYMSFYSGTPFTYEIKLSAYDGTKTLYVVSGSYRIPAVYDAKTNTYVATGYFDPIGKAYVPENVTLELSGCTLANTSFRFPFIIDPSGFIYEAVHSNRIEGALVSIFFRDENDLAQLWEEAFIYGQESSILTGLDGVFSWNVPNGYWQVKAEKEGYEDGFSDWLPVPPEQLDVYVGLITKLSPNVKYINGYTDGIDVTFDQYMDITTVNSNNIVVTDESGEIVAGSWAPVNPEMSGTDYNVYYATTFTFTPDKTLEGKYTVTVDGVENYADKEISVPYINTVTVKQRVESLDAPATLDLVYGKDYTDSDENKIVLDGGIEAAGLKVNVALSNNFYVESVSTVTLDDSGKAVIEIIPSRPGITTVSFNLDGTDLVEKTEITVSMPGETRVTGVSLLENSAELQTGAEKQLSATVAPDFATNTAVVWSSSNNSVATVDENGLVKAVKAGSATITVTTVDGGFSASCAVNVVPSSYFCPDCGDEFFNAAEYNAHVAAEARMKATVKIKNNDGSKTIKYGETLELTAITENKPEDAVIVWFVDGEKQGEGEKFSLTFKEGTKTVEVKLVGADGEVLKNADENEIKDTESVTVKAGFFQKIISFFKNLFRMNRTVVQTFSKGIF